MVKADEIVVISGQVAVDMDGNVVGKTIEEQTAAMLENCRTQIANGGCSFHDVFKVNVYLTDLAMWDRFNGVYKSVMPQPYPARTAVQAALLDDFIVEIEMWAAKP
jgi:2-iminobutanoate/2-iminopropanoate deaminase